MLGKRFFQSIYHHMVPGNIISLVKWINGNKVKAFPIVFLYYLRPAAGKRVPIGQNPYPKDAAWILHCRNVNPLAVATAPSRTFLFARFSVAPLPITHI